MKSEPTRRDFLRAGLTTGAAVMTGLSPAFVQQSRGEAGKFPDVAIASGKDAAAITKAAVDAIGGIKRFVKPGNKVVIKPNMSFSAGPGEGPNTNPVVVAEVARLCSEAGASRIAVLDYVLHAPQDCLTMSRIPQHCAGIPNTSVSVVQGDRMFRDVEVPKGKQLKKMRVVGEVLDSDVLIAVPVGKSHSAAGVSLSMKGMMGLIQDRMIFHTRYDLHEAIVDMASVLTPQLVVIDGTRILSTGGPGGPGKVIPLDMVIASADMLAADAQMVASGTWYGQKFTPKQVKHIRIAAERGLGRCDLENLTIKEIKA